MKSSDGHYFQGLDHIRALAAFVVFAWHFVHFNEGHLAGPLVFPLSFLTEGHTGVAIFMTLSGYLFAKLLNGRRIIYHRFLWNRFIRLVPLLFFVLALVAAERHLNGTLDADFLKSIIQGLVLPTLPNGGWSITVEFHFYLILPLLLWIARRSTPLFVATLLLPISLRTLYFLAQGEVQTLAYWTLFGRIDQFILGMAAFYARHLLAGRGAWVFVSTLLFLVFWYAFDAGGGFYASPAYPSPSPVWILLPTLEGLAYSLLIAWYAGRTRNHTGRLAKGIALIGTYSYSIYLLHFFLVFKLPVWINSYLFELSNPYLLLLLSIPGFLLMVPFAFLTWKLIEEPCLSFMKHYLRPDQA